MEDKLEFVTAVGAFNHKITRYILLLLEFSPHPHPVDKH